MVVIDLEPAERDEQVAIQLTRFELGILAGLLVRLLEVEPKATCANVRRLSKKLWRAAAENPYVANKA